MASSPSMASPTSCSSSVDRDSVERRVSAASNARASSRSTPSCTVPAMPASVCVARSMASLMTPCCRNVSCSSRIVCSSACASPLNKVNTVVDTACSPSITCGASACGASAGAAASGVRPGIDAAGGVAGAVTATGASGVAGTAAATGATSRFMASTSASRSASSAGWSPACSFATAAAK